MQVWAPDNGVPLRPITLDSVKNLPIFVIIDIYMPFVTRKF